MNPNSDIGNRCAESYGRLKNLKLVEREIGVPWQTVYVHLRRAGIPVTGDKATYGSASDKLAAKAEREFSFLVPDAFNNNHQAWQPKVDFVVNGYGVDIKASTFRSGGAATQSKRWSFASKKQEMIADFLVCFAYSNPDAYRTLLIPGEIVRKFQTISLNASGGKWWDYEVPQAGLEHFFRNLPPKERT